MATELTMGVYGGQGEGISIITGGEHRGCGIFVPLGYRYCPPEGQELLAATLSAKPFGLGVPMSQPEGLLPGEVRIEAGGGYIHLHQNGEVEINSLRITRDGKLIEKWAG